MAITGVTPILNVSDVLAQPVVINYSIGEYLGPHDGLTVPACMAMIPPAVISQRTSTSPIAVIAAPSPRASGKRRTELGR